MKSILFTAFFAFILSGVFTGSAPNPVDSPFLQQSKKTLEQEGGWLGVSISDVGKQRAVELGLKSAEGAYVASVVDDSPADSIGLKEGDVITTFAGRQIYDADDLSKSVRRTAPGTKIALNIVRKGEKKAFSVIVGTAPSRKRVVTIRAPRTRGLMVVSEMGSQGMILTGLNEQLAQYFEVPDEEGVLVMEVKESSAAQKAGIKAGDVLLRVGGKRIDEVSDVPRVFGTFDEGEKTDIELIRKGSKKTVTITLEENEGTWNIYMPHGQLEGELFAPDQFEHFNYRFDVEEPDLKELHLKLENMNKSLKLQEDQLRKSIETTIHMREIRTI